MNENRLTDSEREKKLQEIIYRINEQNREKIVIMNCKKERD